MAVTVKTTFTNSSFNKLDVECLEKILEYCSNNTSTLFKCILVNRLWCHIAIPLLWRNPFEYLKFQKHDHGWQLIRTYLCCLPDNEKKIVNEWILQSDIQTPLFDYPRYLKCFDTFGFQEAMTKWKRHHWRTVWERLGHFDVDKAIGDILFRSCKGLDSLCIIFFAYSQNIEYFEEPSNALTNLQTCKIVHDLQGRYYNYTENREQVTLIDNFNIITRYAHNIKNLEINLPVNREGKTGHKLVELLENQKNLENFVVREFWDIILTANIFETLKLQCNTLNSLSFIRLTHFHEKLSHLLNSCPNLKTLRFLEPDIRDDSEISPFNCKLNNFCVWGKPMISQFIINPDVTFQLDIIKSIIETSSSTLTKLALGTFTKELCTTIFQCSNLKFLAIQAKEDISSLFPQYLLTSDLQQLTLLGKHKNYFNQNTLLKFSNSLPSSLYNLDLLLEIIPKDLIYLLSNCSSPFEKISLYHQQNVLEQNLPLFLTGFINKSNKFIELRYIIDNKVCGEVYLEPILQTLRKIPKINVVLGKNNFYPCYFQDTGYF
ncbi:hypothetical protein C1645_820387 [Glomus cerebriforme]|uniref:F-box domain-containing protein n=1 Tax=Glomus cerebriforme TaxID=658196 RepID=A0A397T4A3_9GLOM|nr:hypothetical protein C1645_820387 [Glomus cerebriforme]